MSDKCNHYWESICVDPGYPNCLICEVERLEAKVDSLMLEYCPDEMTPEQVAEWGKHQVPADAQLVKLRDEVAAFEEMVAKWRRDANGRLIDFPAELNRRAAVEQEMFNCINGKRMMPDKDVLKDWALRLGIPDEYRNAKAQEQSDE